MEETLATIEPGEAGQSWMIFRTRPRREKKVAEWFAQHQLRHYLPLSRSTMRRKGRRYSSSLPLFPGYVFGCCNECDRLRAMQSGHLAQWLEVVDQGQFLSELRDIATASAGGTGLHLYPALQRGRSVQVLRGPLEGLIGKISRRKESYRIVLNLTAMNCSVVAEVDMQDVVEVADSVFREG
jgi:transcriptional antiterminator RfaH